MECSEPGAIRDEELVAYLAEEAVRPVVVKHLTQCQRCSLQLATYHRVELELLSKLYRWDCPPNQVLGEYQMGMLPPGQVLTVKNHLYTCVLCAAEVATLTEFLANDPMLAQPVTQKAAAVSSIATNKQHTAPDVQRTLDQLREQSLVGIRRIAATLLPQQPRLAYQRNARSQLALWPRRYTAENVTISVQVELDVSRKDTIQLIGFATQKEMAVDTLQGSNARLSPIGTGVKTIHTQIIDELGNFVFSALTPGDYVLEIQLAEGIIVIDKLVITVQE